MSNPILLSLNELLYQQVLGYDGCYDSGTCPHGFRGVDGAFSLNY